MPAYMTRSLAIGISSIALTACQLAAPSANSPATGRALAENSEARCTIQSPADYRDLKEIGKLPDPFEFKGGGRAKTRNDWTCRRAEVAAQVQKYELGVKPKPADSVVGRVNEGSLLVTVSHGGKTVSFPLKIRIPRGGQAPYPAIIGLGAVSLNNDELSDLGIALISFPNNDIGEQMGASSRGKGKFYELFGRDNNAGAMMAWSWGVSRLIDALEQTPDARIDTTRLGVTGCSRNGKGAIVAGAFDDRIALTIAQESGSGGSASWRISDAQLASGQNVQTLQEIVQENVWFADSFKQFSHSAAKLPFDQHMVMGLIAPRGLLVIENTSMEWLGNESSYVNPVAAREIWKALGVPDAMGVSQVGGHKHCKLPVSQYRYVSNFAKKFLLGYTRIDTNVQETDGDFSQAAGKWITWTTPALRNE